MDRLDVLKADFYKLRQSPNLKLELDLFEIRLFFCIAEYLQKILEKL